MLLYGSICGLLHTRLPGPGAIQLTQQLKFPSATGVDEEVTLLVRVTANEPARRLIALETQVIRPDGSLGLEGSTWVWLPSITGEQRPLTPESESVESRASDPVFRHLELGQHAMDRRVFSLEDLEVYEALTGDFNPKEASWNGDGKSEPIGMPIPGGLVGGLISELLGTRLPGPGTNYLKQRLTFLVPLFTGEVITTSVEIVRIRAEKQLVNLRSACRKPTGELACLGEALVLVRDLV